MHCSKLSYTKSHTRHTLYLKFTCQVPQIQLPGTSNSPASDWPPSPYFVPLCTLQYTFVTTHQKWNGHTTDSIMVPVDPLGTQGYMPANTLVTVPKCRHQPVHPLDAASSSYRQPRYMGCETVHRGACNADGLLHTLGALRALKGKQQ